MPEEVVVTKNVKSTVSWTYVINDLNDEGIIWMFYKKESQKANLQQFTIEKVIERKGRKLCVKCKGYDN